MRAAVINAIGQGFDVEEVQIDEPRGAEVLVEVKAAGLCHSDYSVANNDRGRPLPMVVGHEMAGVVVQLGPEAQEFQIGDHVIGTEVSSCLQCEACTGGAPYRCLHPEAVHRSKSDPMKLRQADRDIHGFGLSAFAEYSVVHQNKLVKIPKEVPFQQAAVLGCATATGVGAVLNSAKVQPGESVVVIGLGGVGLNALSGAALAGARHIIGVDIQDDKLALASRFGATHVFNGGADDVIERIKAVTGGGVDHAFEVIGLGATQRQAIEATRVGGAVHFVGIPKSGPLELNVMTDLLIGQRSLHGVYMGASDVRKDIPYYCDLYLQGRLNLDDLIAQEIALEDINAAYEQQANGAIARSIIRFE